MSTELFRTAQKAELLQGMRHARMAIGRGQVVCNPRAAAAGVVADAATATGLEAL